MKTQLVIPAIAGAFIASLLLFFVVTMTPGTHSDATDWAMYVMHTRNIVTHQPYAATGYIFQPESTTELGANAYPSGVPLLLAPIYAVRGFDLRLFKLLNCTILALSLWPAYLFARRTLSQLSSLLIIVSLGFSTLFLSNFDAIGSDAPYQFVSLWVLLLLLRIYDNRLNETNPWLWGCLAGLCIAIAYLIRPFGVAFLFAVGALELLRNRRITAFAIATGFTFVPLLVLNNFLFHADGGYSHQFTLSVKAITHHAKDYAGYFSYAFANPVSNLYRYALWALTLIPVGFGVAKRIRAGVSVPELYVLTLLAVDCVYWATTARYLLPIMPIYLVYIFEGFQALVEKVPNRLSLPLKATAAALFLFAPAANAVLARPNPADTLVTAPPYEELCSIVRNQTEKNALFIFWNPRVLALSTSRFASGWPAVSEPAAVERYFDRIHANYVIVDKNNQDDRQFLIPALATFSGRFTTIFENSQFRLLRMAADGSRGQRSE